MVAEVEAAASAEVSVNVQTSEVFESGFAQQAVHNSSGLTIEKRHPLDLGGLINGGAKCGQEDN